MLHVKVFLSGGIKPVPQFINLSHLLLSLKINKKSPDGGSVFDPITVQ